MKFESALCIYPESPLGAPSYKYFPPLGLEIIATVIHNTGIPVDMIDRRHEPDISPYLKTSRQLIGISSNWDYEVPSLPQVLKDIPDGFTIIVGGRSATTHAEEILKDCPKVAGIVRGDGEEIIREIAEGKPFEEIDGISYRKNGEIIHNKNRDLKDMDNNLIVNRSLRKYRYGPPEYDVELDFMSTSRGCPFSCKFCNFSNNPLGQKRNWTGRSPESVLEELKTIKYRNVFITDDNFAADTKRVERICDLIMENGIRKNFFAAVRIEISKHPTMLEKMKKAGIKFLLIGIEAATDRILKMMNKGFTTEQAIKAMKIIKKYGFYCHGFLIIGNFTETKEDMLQIPDYARKLDLDTFEVLILRTDKYSPLNDIMKEYPEYHKEMQSYEMLIYSDKYSIVGLTEIKNEITRRYYTPTRILKIFRNLHSTGMIGFPNLVRYATYLVKKEIVPIFTGKFKTAG
ncbi:MAG: radical SAM protein [Armatimonadetes bacterium]|nr:radical SAM protein [Armatimonadota bacterium]